MFDASKLPQNAQVFIPINEFIPLFRDLIREEIRTKYEDELKSKELSKKEAAKLLNVSEGTIDNWSDAGIITKHFRGRLTYFLYSELLDSKKSLKRYSRKPIHE